MTQPQRTWLFNVAYELDVKPRKEVERDGRVYNIVEIQADSLEQLAANLRDLAAWDEARSVDKLKRNNRS